MSGLDQRLSGLDPDRVEHQATLTRMLLDYTHVPLADGVFLRGVLPAPDAVRMVTGASGVTEASELTAYEIPLTYEENEPVTWPLVLGWTRALASAGGAPNGSVMGMPLVRVDTEAMKPADLTDTDRSLSMLRTLAWPYVETPPSPALCGFMLTGRGGMRLYVAVEEAGGLVRADVTLRGAVTALLAALPSLVTEEERWSRDENDPHCVRTIDLTHW